jgi:AraC-like DNA-binding protein
MDQRVLKVIALMKETLHKGWPAGRLAGCVNLSPSRLHQVFKEEIGLPPARYLRLLRMRQARELLETSHLSVKQVMARVGLTDESHFIRDFKKAYGLTPARYRERFLGGLLHEGTLKLPPRSSVPARAASSLSTKRPPAGPPEVGATAPPLLLRRPSHPHQLTPDKSTAIHVRDRAELLSLLTLRHNAFAELTTASTNHIARGMKGLRSINYRPRRSATSRRLPPAAERPQAPPARTPRSSVSRSLPPALPARRKD